MGGGGNSNGGEGGVGGVWGVGGLRVRPLAEGVLGEELKGGTPLPGTEHL